MGAVSRAPHTQGLGTAPTAHRLQVPLPHETFQCLLALSGHDLRLGGVCKAFSFSPHSAWCSTHDTSLDVTQGIEGSKTQADDKNTIRTQGLCLLLSALHLWVGVGSCKAVQEIHPTEMGGMQSTFPSKFTQMEEKLLPSPIPLSQWFGALKALFQFYFCIYKEKTTYSFFYGLTQ